MGHFCGIFSECGEEEGGGGGGGLGRVGDGGGVSVVFTGTN